MDQIEKRETDNGSDRATEILQRQPHKSLQSENPECENEKISDPNIPLTWENSKEIIMRQSQNEILRISLQKHLRKLNNVVDKDENLLRFCEICRPDVDEVWKFFEVTKLQIEERKLVVLTCVEENFGEVVEKILKILRLSEHNGLQFESHLWNCLKKIFSISWILSDACENFCHDHLSSVLVNLMKLELKQSKHIIFYVKFSLGILHNCLRLVNECKDEVQNILALKNFESISSEYKDFPMINAKAYIAMSYIINESESEHIMADSTVFTFLLDILKTAWQSSDHMSRKYGMCVSEVLLGLNNLSINDSNKVLLVKLGCLPLYINIAQSGSRICQGGSKIESVAGNEDEVTLAVTGLWKLSFSSSNRPVMKGDKICMEVLHQLEYSENPSVCHAARGALWELYQPDGLKINTSLDSIRPHVMISYQWDSQSTMIKVKDKLKIAGYKVWMDVEHMTGSTLEAMSLAVEGAAVVLICMSEKYKNSPSCRSEAEYTYKLRKSFIPLRLQSNYNPDGWLGMLIGTRLYFDFSNETEMDGMLAKLVKELGTRGKTTTRQDSVDGECFSS
ncbi:hypothetical protein FSP39_008398 [Pinctada imbricata]|uniref:TIR domain-containing protein n=1 Tax=Pinctada imbricata TaxID=66713 RepID=A0AA88YHZ7_PINIB|nr:hypothetical protein FSP39_008398 [Pinctada imbricata]